MSDTAPGGGVSVQRKEFDGLTRGYLDSLYNMALRLTRNVDEAQDLVQDTYVKAYRFFHRFEQGTSIKAWLFKILINLHKDSLRRSMRRPKVVSLEGQQFHPEKVDETMTDPPLNAEQILAHRQVQEKLRQTIDGLPLPIRRTVVLVDLEGLSYKEVAQILECPIGTVMSRLYRGRQMLRKSLWQEAKMLGYLEAECPLVTEEVMEAGVSEDEF